MDEYNRNGEIEFLATIPTTRTAWTVTGDSPPSATLKLEIPASQFEAVMGLMGRGHEHVLRFKVTIED